MLHDGRLFGRSSRGFTLQWHLTNECDGACRHCYDRSRRETLSLAQARDVVRQLVTFCQERGVQGAVSLSGGNPLLYPGFVELYRVLAATDLELSILGNPMSAEELAALTAIRVPRYFQVSLEGLAAHDDEIRGPGHFERTVAFLQVLREHGVRGHVMLTLHRGNLDQVVPLTERLRGEAHRFMFNRLAQVGSGRALEQPTTAELVDLMRAYSRAAQGNPMLGFKENLFNIPRSHYGHRLVGGCTGAGCGAAFNFVALLPDGEIHACRKLPSRIGHILDEGLAATYDSPAAQRYRDGCAACYFCPIRNSCGGCLAVGYGAGRDIFTEVDPHCFFDDREEVLRPRGQGSS